jgi:hypothetical protein
MGIGTLRVFNHDTLVPGAVWPMHPHRDIEGITYVAEGTFEHADSLGNDGVLPPGSVQRVTLGSGMEHSERNALKTEPMRFIQLWIHPAKRGLEPSIEQRSFSEGSRRNRLKPVLVPAKGYGGEGAAHDRDAVTVHQDAVLFAGLLDPGKTVSHRFRRDRTTARAVAVIGDEPAPRLSEEESHRLFGGYLFVVHGSLARPELDEGGAAKIVDEPEIAITAADDGAEVLLVETRLRPMAQP